MKNNQQNTQSPILDRLIDNEPGVTSEPVQNRLLSIGQIKASVIRDLENLLNSRRTILPPPPEYKELGNSVLVYGLRDFTSLDPRSPNVRQQLRNDVEKTISRFDSRLRNVSVQIEMSTQNERNMRFRITALLVIEPLSEPVTFDTYFDINRGEYVIQK